jgi:formylglycine-generating enzyme required for sulfatase activity
LTITQGREERGFNRRHFCYDRRLKGFIPAQVAGLRGLGAERWGSMAEVFISYKSERRKAAEHLAEVLKYYGYSVWFDYQLIKGDDFRTQIEARIREAKALIVLWCTMSVRSPWVAEEAGLASKRGILVPVKIEPCELPFGFGFQDYINMVSWDAAPRGPQLDPLIEALEQRIGRAANLDLRGVRQYEAHWRRFGAPTLKDFALSPPLADVETPRPAAVTDDPSGPQLATTTAASRHELMAIAAQEWPAARDSRDACRLRVFEKHFAGTYYSELARRLREGIETAEGPQREAEAREQAEEARRKAEGQIQLHAPEIIVPAGTFQMGSRDGEGGDQEWPQHKVTIAGPFAVGRFAVTFDEWDAAYKNGGVKHNPGDAGWGRGRRPVINVSWEDATAYVGWLSRETGKSYRLLSEAEWEYCCRAGTTTAYSFGDTIDNKQAQFSESKTAEVGSLPANGWGLHDMHGNVWEWCEDTWHPNYKGAPNDGSNWKGGDLSSRVLRGGSWLNGPHFLRSAVRLRNPSDVRNDHVGFRVARRL